MLRRLFVLLGILAPAEVAALADATPGPVRLVGVLRCSDPIRSPIRGRPCIGYTYRASAVGSGRASAGVRMRTLRRATVYAGGVSLEVDDAALALDLPASDEFSSDAHARLVEMDLGGFRAVESTLADGQRVTIEGRLSHDPSDAPRVRVKAIILPKQIEPE